MTFSDTAVDLASPDFSPNLEQDEFAGMSERSYSRMSFAPVPPPNRALLWDKENEEA